VDASKVLVDRVPLFLLLRDDVMNELANIGIDPPRSRRLDDERSQRSPTLVVTKVALEILGER
jgi:hypothetical protein